MVFPFIVYISIFLLLLHFYRKRKGAEVLTCLFTLGSGCFKLLPIQNTIVSPLDLIIFAIIIISCIEYSKNPTYFNTKNDPIGRVVLYVFFFTAMVCVGTVLTGQEMLSYALKVFRVNFTFLIYFYIRKQDWSVAKRFMDLMLSLSIIQGVLFYLQLFDVNLLQGSASEMAGNVRYGNFPALAVLFILYSIFNKEWTIVKRTFVIVYFGSMLLMSMNRGPFLVLFMAIILYFLIHRRVKNILYMLLLGLVYVFAISPMLEKRGSERGGSTREEITQILNDPLGAHNHFVRGEGGTMLYRIATLTEKLEYILNNPKYIPFGIGCVHENSPMNQYNLFLLGLQNENLQYGKETIVSDDITWVNVLMSYGLIGVLFFLSLYIVGAKTGLPMVKTSNNPLLIMSALLPLAYLFASFGTNHFDYSYRIQEFMLPLSFIGIELYSKKTAKIR